MSFSAVVLGATGATGKALVKDLLTSDKWLRVTTIGRSPLGDLGNVNRDKLNEVRVCNFIKHFI